MAKIPEKMEMDIKLNIIDKTDNAKIRHFRSLAGSPESIREETLNDEDYIVVPVIALVEGIMQAANADVPAFVSAEEFAKAIDSWNGRPVVVNHPKDKDGEFISAGDPKVFEEEVIGTTFNAVLIDDKKLRVEAWINKSRVNELGGLVKETIDRILAGDEVEISTGYFVDEIEQEGVYDGERFFAVQSDIKPDHLAILDSTKTGACSWEDGCGCARLNERISEQMPMPESNKENKKNEKGEQDDLDGKDQNSAKSIFNILRKKFGNILLFKDHKELNDLDTRAAISAALEVKGEKYFYLIGVYSTFVVYDKDFGSLVMRDYSIDDNGVITLGEDITPVRPVTEFVPIAVNQKDQDSEESDLDKMENNAMTTKEEKVNSLISNEKTKFEEKDREFLLNFEEGQLELMEPIEANSTSDDKEAVDTSSNTETINTSTSGEDRENQENQEEQEEPMTTEKYLENAPDDIREVLEGGMVLQAQHRQALVESVSSNKLSTFEKKELEEMPIAMLEKVEALNRQPDYSGQAGGELSANVDEEDGDIPKPPLAFEIGKYRTRESRENGANGKVS